MPVRWMETHKIYVRLNFGRVNNYKRFLILNFRRVLNIKEIYYKRFAHCAVKQRMCSYFIVY